MLFSIECMSKKDKQVITFGIIFVLRSVPTIFQSGLYLNFSLLELSFYILHKNESKTMCNVKGGA